MAELSEYQLRKWSVLVRWRDRVCQICGKRNRLQAHHLFDKSTYPAMAYDLENGVALCGSVDACHSSFHNRYMGGTAVSCTVMDWYRFAEMFRWSNQVVVE